MTCGEIGILLLLRLQKHVPHASGALEVGAALGTATLDCINPRGPLAAYANVREVCTLR